MKLKALFAALPVSAMLLLSACGEAAAAADGEGAGQPNYLIFVYFALIIVVFYFLLIRPESKKKKKAQELRDNIEVGDEITTIGGMTGKIVSVQENFVTFETGEDRVRIEIAKWAISSKGKSSVQ